MRGPILLLLLALSSEAVDAAPVGEILREESFNYRVLGQLPPGWKQRPGALTYVYAVDAIPHAHIHFVRARVGGEIDAAKALRERVEHYRLPGTPRDLQPSFGETLWADRMAARCVFEVRLKGVLCRRRVTALCIGSIWFELIETVYGEKTEEDANCRIGLRAFSRGFRLLVQPLKKEQLTDTRAERITDEELGVSIQKPKGYMRLQVDPARDPGCRIAFHTRTGNPRQTVRVRLFAYGQLARFEPERMIKDQFGAFERLHKGARSEVQAAPTVPGAQAAHAVLFTGLRDGREVQTRVWILRSAENEVFALRIRAGAGAGVPLGESIREIGRSLALGRN